MARAAAETARRSRPVPLLPAHKGAEGGLVVVIAIVVALSVFAIVVARAAFDASAAWTSELTGSVSVEVTPPVGLGPEAAATQAASVLARLPGVAAAKALDRAELEALVAPWFGAEGVPADVPLPALVDVRLDRAAPASAAALSEALRAAGLDARIDDHAAWAGDLGRAALGIRTIALAVVGLLGVAALLVVVYGVRAGLAAREEVVDTLHTIGAADSFIAAAVMRRFAAIGLRAGAAGGGAAIAGAWLLETAWSGSPAVVLPRFTLDILDIVTAVAAPFLTAAAAGLTARTTALATLRERL